MHLLQTPPTGFVQERRLQGSQQHATKSVQLYDSTYHALCITVVQTPNTHTNVTTLQLSVQTECQGTLPTVGQVLLLSWKAKIKCAQSCHCINMY